MFTPPEEKSVSIEEFTFLDNRCYKDNFPFCNNEFFNILSVIMFPKYPQNLYPLTPKLIFFAEIRFNFIIRKLKSIIIYNLVN